VEPKFLSFTEILKIHQDQILRYGGDSGVRDIELLKSAIGMPSATYGGQFLHTDIYEMAAAYLFHLVQNHPFVDGNKRVGAVSALVFLILNGYVFEAPEDKFAEIVLSVAMGELDKAEVAVFIHRWAEKISD
jgi:death-on-curing protein